MVFPVYLEKPLTETMEEAVMRDGRILRVDHDSGLIGVIHKNGSVGTLFQAKQYGITTVEYLEDKLEKDRKQK